MSRKEIPRAEPTVHETLSYFSPFRPNTVTVRSVLDDLNISMESGELVKAVSNINEALGPMAVKGIVGIILLDRSVERARDRFITKSQLVESEVYDFDYTDQAIAEMAPFLDAYISETYPHELLTEAEAKIDSVMPVLSHGMKWRKDAQDDPDLAAKNALDDIDQVVGDLYLSAVTPEVTDKIYKHFDDWQARYQSDSIESS